MKKFILVTGGARSGKSAFALEKAKKAGRKVLFIATAGIQDKEMAERVRLHKLSRPGTWQTIEEKKDVADRLRQLKKKYDAIIIDCLGLLISNLLSNGYSQRAIEQKLLGLSKAIKKIDTLIILVSNEAGMGIVPDNKLARRFRDLLGKGNQIMSACADEVIFMVSGIPMVIKERQQRCKK